MLADGLTSCNIGWKGGNVKDFSTQGRKNLFSLIYVAFFGIMHRFNDMLSCWPKIPITYPVHESPQEQCDAFENLP